MKIMEVRKDILGNVPKIGDIIVFNPPAYKGLAYGKVLSFSKVGLPQIDGKENDLLYFGRDKDGLYTPKTGFVCIK